jgi:hypothetical protein
MIRKLYSVKILRLWALSAAVSKPDMYAQVFGLDSQAKVIIKIYRKYSDKS